MAENNNNNSFLERFAINLNERAAQGKLTSARPRENWTP